MEIRKFSNIILMLFGGFLIYSQIFKYTLGALFLINESEIINEYVFSFSLNWGAIWGSTLCFVIFIKKVDFLTYCLYRKNYVFDLNEQNQISILNVIFFAFSISALISKFIGYRNLDVWDKVFSSSTIVSLFIILSHRIIIKFMIQKINLYSEEQSKYCFIFSMLTLLFNLYFFRIYNLDYNPSTLYDFALHFMILFVSVCSPIIFNFLTKKEITITNAQFIYIIFFWIVFLYNIQYNFFKEHFNYNSNKEESPFIIKYILFHVLLPLCFLYFHKLSLRIKTFSIFQFLFAVAGTLFVFCGIIRYLDGSSHSSYFYLIFGLLFFFLSQKTSFMDTQLARIKFKVVKRNVEPGMLNNSSFIIITLLIVLFSTNIFTSYSKFNLDYLFYISILAFEFVIIGKLALSKKIRLISVNDFIELIIISISITLLTNNLIGRLISKLFNRHLIEPMEATYIGTIIALFGMILFSSQIANMIKVIVEKFQTIWRLSPDSDRSEILKR